MTNSIYKHTFFALRFFIWICLAPLCAFGAESSETLQSTESAPAQAHLPDSSSNANALDSSHAESTQATIQALIDKANALNLANHKAWKTLLHIDKDSSEITSPYFFLHAKNGSIAKQNLAQIELEATIKAFYESVEDITIPAVIIKRRQEQIKLYRDNDITLPTRSILKADYHALCRFPARFAFLKQFLDFRDLPELECAEFKLTRDYMSPSIARIVFPSAYINSPASMFGHTFLLLDSSFKSRLLAFAINYQADANPNVENGVAFAFKGLFGLYTGSYSILPYYDKIKEYSNVESRDMWEYELNLDKDEITRLYNHIWELGDAYSTYYFFHRNCSYNILWLLEVARPSLELRKQFIYQVNPPETLFALKNAGLIADVSYRPSKRTKLFSYESYMQSADIKLAKKLAKGTLEPQALDSTLSLNQKQYILESALELSEYHFLKGDLDKENYTAIAHNLAKERATLGQNTPPPLPKASNPLEGNQSLRISPMILVNKASANPALDFRLTFHDITDNDKGYLKGSQIELLRTLAYFDTQQNKAKIFELNILSVASIAPLGKFFKPISYRLETGFNRTFFDENLHYFASFGTGVALNLGSVGYGYYLLEPSFFVLDSTAKGAISNVAGLVLSDNNDLKLAIEYKFRAYSLARFNHILDSTLSYNLAQNLGIFTRYSHSTSYTNPSYMVGIRWYF